MMIKTVSRRDLLENGTRDVMYRRDRKDMYEAVSQSLSESSMGVRIYYRPCELNCDPDYDW